jgi:hypothetical protein
MPSVEVHIISSSEPPTGIGEPGVPAGRACRVECDLRGHWKAALLAALGFRVTQGSLAQNSVCRLRPAHLSAVIWVARDCG